MPAKRKILVTSALPYANGALHLGHMVGYIQADIWVRTQKMLGHDCIYVCGSDGHGTPIMIQAEKIGISPEELISKNHDEQLRDFNDFLVSFDNYYKTHSPENKELVETIYERHLKDGNITKRVIKQAFDPVKNMFLPDRYIKGECPKCGAKDQYGDNCEVCGAAYTQEELKNPYSTLSGAKPIEKESEHYFFKLQNFEDYLKEWTRKGHLQKEVTNKLNEWFESGLQEWDISRDAPYFGFPIPNHEGKYFYVWLDAPVGYIASFKNLCEKRKDLDFDEYWNQHSQVELYHFIGKDIIYFHALFWPAVLHGAKFRTPTAIFANGFLTVNGQKMSKSRGTFIKARTYLDHLQPEYLRYYFAAKLSDRIEDLDINFDDFIQRVNSDLVGKFINIASRCAPFLTKHFGGKMSDSVSDIILYDSFAFAGEELAEKLQNMEYSQVIRQIMALTDRANQFIDEQKPWQLAKDPNNKQAVQDVCSLGINLFRVLMIYLKPILPHTANEIEKFLNIKPLVWDDKDTPLTSHTINEFTPLINRINTKQIEALKMAAQEDISQSTPATAQAAPAAPAAENKYISIDDFSKVDLRVAKILEAEAVEGADKLLKLKVDLGSETRQVFSGIKSSYQPEQLIGRHVVVVANLAPRKMRFGLSEGMILAASSDKDEIFIVELDDGAKAGMKVK
ncbi:MAG TPA: methionine--tRNA ligase [Gammaproteobacteria bacterium]|jgi:methionyl-tRNA synthetase|nr:methionine--tRNA ligase [Gammaproteobacteria bacterium]